MKKLVLIIATLSNSILIIAQITLEQTYDSTGYYYDGGNSARKSQLFMVTLESSGQKYVDIDRNNRQIRFYNLNHSIYKTISLSSLPVGWQTSDIIYISEHLFASDDKIEFMYIVNDGPNPSMTLIVNEDGIVLLQVDSAAPYVRANIRQQQEPIYNTQNGTKMILSHYNQSALVYGLEGTLSATKKDLNKHKINNNTGDIHLYPNPSINRIRVHYKLPQGINDGEIVFYNINGSEVKRFKIDRTFDHLLISTAELSAGTYYYNLQTSKGLSAGKKMIKIK